MFRHTGHVMDDISYPLMVTHEAIEMTGVGWRGWRGEGCPGGEEGTPLNSAIRCAAEMKYFYRGAFL